MRWLKIIFLVFIFLFTAYSAIIYFFAEESKSFTIQEEINYPVDKVFQQFNNFQNFTKWNNYFANSKDIRIEYYQPYEGQGSSISFYDKKNNRNGEMFIRYQNLNKTLKYQLFEGEKSAPTSIDIKFIGVSPEKTKMIWYVKTAKQPFLKRSVNFWTEEKFAENLNSSFSNLTTLLGNKVEKYQKLSSIKYDSVMVEQQDANLLLGVNVSSANKKDGLFKNIIINHNKVYNFVTSDLGKNEDEFGYPILVTNPGNYKDKEVSYFYGIPLSKKVGISDNNFSFRTVSSTKAYIIYFKGNYINRIKSIQQLLQKIKKDTLRNGDLYQTFLESPEEGKDVNIKLSIPVYR